MNLKSATVLVIIAAALQILNGIIWGLVNFGMFGYNMILSIWSSASQIFLGLSLMIFFITIYQKQQG